MSDNFVSRLIGEIEKMTLEELTNLLKKYKIEFEYNNLKIGESVEEKNKR